MGAPMYRDTSYTAFATLDGVSLMSGGSVPAGR